MRHRRERAVRMHARKLPSSELNPRLAGIPLRFIIELYNLQDKSPDFDENPFFLNRVELEQSHAPVIEL